MFTRTPDAAHRGDMLRYLLLRFLPRRLVPLLFLFEIFRLIRRWQTRNDPDMDRPLRHVGPIDVDGTPRYLANPRV